MKLVSIDFLIGKGCWSRLLKYQLDNTITGKISTVTKNRDVVTIIWDIGLTSPEIAIQDGIIAAHDTIIPWQTALLTSVDSVNDSYLSAFNAAGGILIITSWTDLTWDTQNRIDGDYSHTLGSASITIDTTADYEINVDVTNSPTGTTSRSESEIRLVKNGVFVPGTKGLLYHRNTAQGGNSASFKIVLSLVATDIIKVQSILRSGSGIISTYPDGCRITIRKINN